MITHKPNYAPLLGIALLFFTFACSQRKLEEQVNAAYSSRLNNHLDWGIYRGNAEGIKYSSLDQVHTGNVQLL